MIIPAVKTKVKTTDLQSILGNLELLYVKAKNYHWNVKGITFRPLHKTFDGVQEVALDWADTIAERMRALGMDVDSRSARYLKDAWFSEGIYTKSAVEMTQDLSDTLRTISQRTTTILVGMNNDLVTQNKLQDLVSDIDKQFYFVNSSLPE